MDNLFTFALILIFIGRIGAIRSRSRAHGGTHCHDSDDDFLEKRHDQVNTFPLDRHPHPFDWSEPYDPIYHPDDSWPGHNF